MRGSGVTLLVLVSVLLINIIFTSQAASAIPSRVVSLNLCADELILALAKPSQIASVSWLVKDPKTSWDAQLARDIPGNRGAAEEVLKFQPDLVIAGRYTTTTTIDLLGKFSVPVLILDLPRNLAEVRQQIQKVGQALGRSAAARQLIMDIDAAMGEAPTNSNRPSAIVYHPQWIYYR